MSSANYHEHCHSRITQLQSPRYNVTHRQLNLLLPAPIDFEPRDLDLCVKIITYVMKQLFINKERKTNRKSLRERAQREKESESLFPLSPKTYDSTLTTTK
jgi:hypothetical protein